MLMVQRVCIAPLGRHVATDQGHYGPRTSMRAESALGLKSCGAPTRVRHTAMSITMSTTTFPPSDPLTWKQADDDVHVATRAGEFAGFVEFDGTTHLVRDNRGTELGAFASLDDAFSALEEAHESVTRGPAFAPILPRAWRRRTRRARS